MSDISSSTHNDSQNPIIASQSQPQLAQVPQQVFVTQTMDSNFGPDHIINDLFFPMDLDAKPSEYNTSKSINHMYISLTNHLKQ
jgi:hypothetical protein